LIISSNANGAIPLVFSHMSTTHAAMQEACTIQQKYFQLTKISNKSPKTGRPQSGKISPHATRYGILLKFFAVAQNKHPNFWRL
jgi:hypothetical protein